MPMAALGSHWPTYGEFLALDGTRLLNVGRRLRLAWALMRGRPWRAVLQATARHCPYLRPTLAQRPVLFRPLVTQFLDPRLGTGMRYVSVAHDLEFTGSRVHDAFPGFFPADLKAALWIGPEGGWTVELALNVQSPQEGLWRLSLVGRDGVRAFSLCFSVLPGRRLFVGAAQGGTVGAGYGALDHIQAATRDLHGMRPPFFLFEVLRTLARTWDVQAITGVATRYQPKNWAKWRARREVRFSYDAYFRDLGGVVGGDGNWDVPLAAPERPLEEVPSRKRAMYRRRFALLRELRASVGARFRRGALESGGLGRSDAA
jgi:uncharacterized protein VirK/YbjX